MSVVSRELRSIIFNASLHPISLATNPKILGTGILIGAGVQMADNTDTQTWSSLTYPEKFISTSIMGVSGAFIGLATTFVVCATYPIIITAAIISVAIK
jgi:hypothetical protein